MNVQIAPLVRFLTFLGVSSVFLMPTILFAHGDEDHGDQKPATVANSKGTVSHIKRLGDIEMMLKYPELIPDTATTAKLFITKFETNESVDKLISVIEIESSDGSITQAVVEKTEDAGIVSVKIPALPQGTYILRAKIAIKGETDTVTFSGVEIRPEPAAIIGSGLSWLWNILIGAIFLIVLALFGLLAYFVLRFSASDQIDTEAVSA